MEYIILGLVVLCAGAAGLAYRRRRVAPTVDRQEKAAFALTGYAERLRACAEEIEQPHADIFWDMAAHVERIRAEVLSDQRDLTRAGRFIHHHARLIVDLVERFVVLSAKARPEHASRLHEMAVQVHSYRNVFGRVEKACIDNDFDDIEATMAALDVQLERLAL